MTPGNKESVKAGALRQIIAKMEAAQKAGLWDLIEDEGPVAEIFAHHINHVLATCGNNSPDGLDCLKCARWWGGLIHHLGKVAHDVTLPKGRDSLSGSVRSKGIAVASGHAPIWNILSGFILATILLTPWVL